jgi:hypothetical protein
MQPLPKLSEGPDTLQPESSDADAFQGAIAESEPAAHELDHADLPWHLGNPECRSAFRAFASQIIGS